MRYQDLKNIFFWEPSLSIHKTPLLNSLSAKFPEVEFIYVSDKDVSEERIGQGWNNSDRQDFKLIISPSSTEIENLVSSSVGNSIHIFSGIRHYSTLVYGMRAVRKYGANFGVYSEPRVTEGLGGKLRYFQSLIQEAWIRREVKFVLAIGVNGYPWFKSVGYAPNKIFPAAYFINEQVENNIILREKIKRSNKKIHISFVGRLCKEKGFHHFLQSLRYLDPERYEVTVIGRGGLEDFFQNVMSTLAIDITHVKMVPNDQMHHYYANFDLLVLPSTTTDDGWGAVVSEALLNGVGVIVSSCAGSSILMSDSRLGVKLEKVNSINIASKIKLFENVSFYSQEHRDFRNLWAQERLTCSAGAEYVMAIIQHSFFQKPKPKYFYL